MSAHQRDHIPALRDAIERKKAQLDNQPAIEPLLDFRDIMRITRSCRRAIYNRLESGDFPQPIRFGRRVLWRASDIAAWMNSLKSAA